jgi:hypothetical protein
MDRFNALGRGAQVMLVAGVLLLISLFLPWQDFGVSEAVGVDVDDTFSGWRGVGVVLGLATIALVAWLVVRLLSVDIPLPLSTAMISAILGGLVLVFGIIKILTILGDETTIWAWIGTILAIVVGIGAWLEVQAAGGVATLRSEIPTSGTTTTSTSTVTGTQAPEPPPPAPTAPSQPEAAPPPVEPAPPAEPAEPTAPTEPETPYEPEERREP